MDLRSFVDVLPSTMITLAVIVFFVQSLGIPAPYGRYQRPGWGPTVPTRLAWAIQESPSAIIPMFVVWIQPEEVKAGMSWPACIMAAAFIAHYFHRAFIYPLSMRPDNETPLLTAALAFLFCSCNGFLQAAMWFRALPPPSTVLWLFGIVLWALGAAINLHSDYHLLHLRHALGPGVHQPTDELFDLVSSPHFSGEVLEWLGYAVASQHLAATAFAVFTFCNLAPRALQHHADYLERFGAAVPPRAKALIPFVL